MSRLQVNPVAASLARPTDPYTYLPAALAGVEQGGSPDHLVAAIAGYVALGLGEPAADLVERLAEWNPDPVQVAEARAAVRSVRSGRLSWTACSGRFRRNLKVLVERDPSCAIIESAWEARRPGLELFRTLDGDYQVAQLMPGARPCRQGGGRRWLPAFADHQARDQSRPFHHDEKSLMPAPYLFEGLGQGWYFARVYEATRDTFLGFSCALYVVEPDPAMLAVVLHLHDWQSLLADPRVMIFCGPDGAERLGQALEADVDLPLPAVCVRELGWSRGADPSLGEVVRQVAVRRRQQADQSLARIQRQYAGRDAACWARRFCEALDGGGEPLRILTAVSRHTSFLQYSVRDARRAFEALGCRVRVLDEKSNHHTISEVTYHRAIEEFQPDLFFILDHLRGGHERLLPANLPMFTWDQDQLPHVFNRQGVRTIGPLDVVAGLGKRFTVLHLGVPEDKCLCAHVPTSLEEYNPQPLSDEELAPYVCDVSYVSNASQTPEQFHDEQRTALPDNEDRRMLDGVYELTRVAAAGGTLLMRYRCNGIIDRVAGELGVQVREQFRDWLLSWYMWRLKDRIFRHQGLGWVGDWARRPGRTFHLYGRGWDKHETLAPFSRGVAKNGGELRCIYQASAINLQLFPGGFIHQRAIDGLAAGGFFLARWSMAWEDTATRRICARCRELGLETARAMLESDDRALQQAIAAYREWTGDPLDPDDAEVLADLRLQSEYPSASELFPRFKEIIFNDAETFAAVADRYIDNPALRAEVAAGMHRVAVTHFTYDSMMRRFLRFHADYLAGQAKGEGNE